MEMARVSDTQIRFILDKDDLDKKDMDFKDLAFSSDLSPTVQGPHERCEMPDRFWDL